MTEIQLVSGMLIFVLMIIRPFLYKPAARQFPAELSAVFTSVWLMTAIILTFPFWGMSFVMQMPGVFVTPFFWISVIKGIGLWKFTSIQQSVNKESTSHRYMFVMHYLVEFRDFFISCFLGLYSSGFVMSD